MDKGMAGLDWLDSFFRRWPGLVKKIPQDLSIDRTMAMNRKNIEDYLDVLAEDILFWSCIQDG
jgi:hypothetical protein